MTNTTSSTRLIVAALGLSLSCLAFTPATTDVDGRAIPEIEWKTTLKKFQFDKDKFIGHRFTAMCPPSSQKATADTSETAVFPSTHSICQASLQSGAIDAKGGVVTVQLNSGAALHTGSADIGSARSISVVGRANTEMTDIVYRDSIKRIDWYMSFTKTGVAYSHLIGQRFTFECPASPKNLRATKPVGTDLYAFNSKVCPAAVHAGAITMEGGLVTVQMNPKTNKLVGSVRNGIETRAGASGLSAISFVENPVQK